MKPWLLILSLFVYCSVCCQSARNKPAVKGNTAYIYQSPSADGIGKFYKGREIARVMGAAGADWLERSERQMEENTDLAIDSMKLAPGSVVADIGAGTGYYSFRIASQVPQSRIYAVELQQELIDYLTNKKNLTGAKNVEIIKGDTLKVNLPDNSVDLAFMVDVYHELAWPREILQSIGRCLKPEGRILLIEYRGEDPSVPIKPLHKMTMTQLSLEMKANGFILERQGEFLPIQHFAVFRKER